MRQRLRNIVPKSHWEYSTSTGSSLCQWYRKVVLIEYHVVDIQLCHTGVWPLEDALLDAEVIWGVCPTIG